MVAITVQDVAGKINEKLDKSGGRWPSNPEMRRNLEALPDSLPVRISGNSGLAKYHVDQALRLTDQEGNGDLRAVLEVVRDAARDTRYRDMGLDDFVQNHAPALVREKLNPDADFTQVVSTPAVSAESIPAPSENSPVLSQKETPLVLPDWDARAMCIHYQNMIENNKISSGDQVLFRNEYGDKLLVSFSDSQDHRSISAFDANTFDRRGANVEGLYAEAFYRADIPGAAAYGPRCPNNPEYRVFHLTDAEAPTAPREELGSYLNIVHAVAQPGRPSDFLGRASFDSHGHLDLNGDGVGGFSGLVKALLEGLGISGDGVAPISISSGCPLHCDVKGFEDLRPVSLDSQTGQAPVVGPSPSAPAYSIRINPRLA